MTGLNPGIGAAVEFALQIIIINEIITRRWSSVSIKWIRMKASDGVTEELCFYLYICIYKL